MRIGAFVLIGCSTMTNGIAAHGAMVGAMGTVALCMAVASDLFKSSLPVVIRHFASQRSYASAAAASLLLVVSITFSGTLALSGALGSRETGTSDRQHIADNFNSTKTALASTQDQLAKLTAGRTVAQVDADMKAGTGVDPAVWTKTTHCADVTLPASQKSCAPYFAAQAERATAAHYAELQQQQKDLTDKLEGMTAPRPVDALTTAVGRVAGLFGYAAPSQENVSLVSALLAVVVLELGSALGLLVADSLDTLAVSPVTAPGRQEAPAHAEPRVEAVPPAGAQPIEPAALSAVHRQTGGVSLADQTQTEPPLNRRRTAAEPQSEPQSEPQHGLAALVRVLESVGGTFAGSQEELARLIGTNKSAARRLVNAAAVQRLVALATVPGHRTTVKLLRPRLAAV